MALVTIDIPGEGQWDAVFWSGVTLDYVVLENFRVHPVKDHTIRMRSKECNRDVIHLDKGTPLQFTPPDSGKVDATIVMTDSDKCVVEMLDPKRTVAVVKTANLLYRTGLLVDDLLTSTEEFKIIKSDGVLYVVPKSSKEPAVTLKRDAGDSSRKRKEAPVTQAPEFPSSIPPAPPPPSSSPKPRVFIRKAGDPPMLPFRGTSLEDIVRLPDGARAGDVLKYELRLGDERMETSQVLKDDVVPGAFVVVQMHNDECTVHNVVLNGKFVRGSLDSPEIVSVFTKLPMRILFDTVLKESTLSVETMQMVNSCKDDLTVLLDDQPLHKSLAPT